MEDKLRRLHGVLAPRAQAARDAERVAREAYNADLQAKKAALGSAIVRDVAKALKACAREKPVDHIVTHSPFRQQVSYACLPDGLGLSLSSSFDGGFPPGCLAVGVDSLFDSEVAPVVSKAGFATASLREKSYVLTLRSDGKSCTP